MEIQHMYAMFFFCQHTPVMLSVSTLSDEKQAETERDRRPQKMERKGKRVGQTE